MSNNGVAICLFIVNDKCQFQHFRILTINNGNVTNILNVTVYQICVHNLASYVSSNTLRKRA